MKPKSRIASILKANSLCSSITGLPTFNLSQLKLENNLDFDLPTNLRLGHLAESIVSQLIKASSNYQVLFENIQLIEDKQTIGEMDFILKDTITKSLTHMELAYKFYLYDPNISKVTLNNWIGPNRNDSLKNKLEKTKRKQFPLLQHKVAQSTLGLEMKEVSQALCLLVNLYVPYEYKGSINPMYEKAVKGYYFNLETFISLDNSEKSYHFPTKKEWGMDPAENETWTNFKNTEEHLKTSIQEKQAVLCWQKQEDNFIEFFIVWW